MTKKRKTARSDFYQLRFNIGLSAARAAELCGVTRRTIGNWDKKGASATAMRLLRLWDRKYLDGGAQEWEGFLFCRGAIQKGRNLRFRPEHWNIGRGFAKNWAG